MEPSDENLIEQIAAEYPYGTDAFEQLLRRYEPMVYRTCLRYLGNAHDAEEAAQDAFLRVFHGAKKFAGRSSLKTWMYRIVANVCATRYQKNLKRKERKADYQQYFADNFDPDAATATPDTGSDSPGEFEGPVAKALERLSEKDRQIISLRHVSDLSVPEIAEILDLKLSAAKMRLSRAEERFRTNYSEQQANKPTQKGGEDEDFLKNL